MSKKIELLSSILAIIFLLVVVVFWRSCGKSEKEEKEIYNCGGCGAEMVGASWDYDVDYGHLCRSCSKILSNN